MSGEDSVFSSYDSNTAGRLMDAYEMTGDTSYLSRNVSSGCTLGGTHYNFTPEQQDAWRQTYSSTLADFSQGFTDTYTTNTGKTSQVYGRIDDYASALAKWDAIEAAGFTITDDMIESDGDTSSGLKTASRLRGAMRVGLSLDQYLEIYIGVQDVKARTSKGEKKAVIAYIQSMCNSNQANYLIDNVYYSS